MTTTTSEATDIAIVDERPAGEAASPVHESLSLGRVAAELQLILAARRAARNGVPRSVEVPRRAA